MSTIQQLDNHFQLMKIPVSGQYGAHAAAANDNDADPAASSQAAPSSVTGLFENMNTNDYFAIASLILLISIACIGLVAWFSSPQISSKDALTHLMEAAQTPGKKKKIRKKQSGSSSSKDNAGKISSSLDSSEHSEEKKRKKKAKRATRDLEAGGGKHAFSTNDVKLSMSRQDMGEVDLMHTRHALLAAGGGGDGKHSNSRESAFDSAFGKEEGEEEEEDSESRDPDQDDRSTEQKSANSSMASGVTGAYEENLKKSLTSLLRGGMTMTQYRALKPPKTILLSLLGVNDNTLRWRSPRLLARNSYEMKLANVTSIEWGKNTSVFLACNEAAAVSNDMCFSLVFEHNASSLSRGQKSQDTLDLQASSKVERDLLVQGFTLLIGDLKQSMLVNEL